MPNWCENKITVKGTNERIQEFLKKYKGKEMWNGIETDTFDFNKIIPAPETFADCPEKYRMSTKEEARKRCLGWDESDPRKWFDWYHWQIDNWGTKWSARDEEFVVSDGKVEIYFNTAWNQPMPILVALQEQNPDLEIKAVWCEPGMCFCGILYPNGGVDRGDCTNIESVVTNEVMQELGYGEDWKSWYTPEEDEEDGDSDEE